MWEYEILDKQMLVHINTNHYSRNDKTMIARYEGKACSSSSSSSSIVNIISLIIIIMVYQ